MYGSAVDHNQPGCAAPRADGPERGFFLLPLLISAYALWKQSSSIRLLNLGVTTPIVLVILAFLLETVFPLVLGSAAFGLGGMVAGGILPRQSD